MSSLLKKLVSLIVTLILVSLLTFLAFNVIPGDPASAMLGTQATSAQLSALRDQLGLNQPLPVRYLSWLTAFAQGNLGSSIKYSMPVSALLTDRVPVTLWLALLALLMTIVIAIPLGILSAKRPGKLVDNVISTLSQFAMAIPPFFLGMLLILLFGVLLRLITPGRYIDYKVDFAGFIGCMILPALAIALPRAAMVARFLRGAMIEQLRADYVRTARSKGMGLNLLLLRHVFKNALIPVIALLSMVVAEILAGSIIIEQVFGLPGIGRLLISAVQFRDFPLAQSMVVILAAVVVVINFLTDLGYRLIDPRLRAGQGR